jgi:hypothetical protein
VDPQPTPSDYLNAETCVRILSQNFAIGFEMDGENWPHEKTQKHINDRAALIRVQSMLIDEAERIHRE